MQQNQKNRKNIGWILILLIGIAIGVESLIGYLDEHQYYQGLFTKTNIYITISALALAAIPIIYFIKARGNCKVFFLLFGLISGIFGTIHNILKMNETDDLIVGFFGYIVPIFNTILLFALGIYTLIGFLSLGSRITQKWIKRKQKRRQEVLLNFGIGLCAFLGIVQFLIGCDLLYGWTSRLLFLGLGVMIYVQKETLAEEVKIIEESKENLNKNTVSSLIITLLLIITGAFLLLGFQNSFIPYSTAWDANHEYMYIPKIISENAGIYRGNSVGGTMPGIWHIFITFFFSLAGGKGLPRDGIFGLGPDTIAVAENFRSAILVLIFGIAIIFEITTFLHKKEETNGIGISIATLLLWLTGGMGAFLVIVDNKTDLGVMALSMLALLAGIIFLEGQEKEENTTKEMKKYLFITGIFFSFACLAKVTAFVDIALFGFFFLGYKISPLLSLGLGSILCGFLRHIKIGASTLMISEEMVKGLIILGILLFIGGVALACKQKKRILNEIKNTLFLGISFCIPLVIFKLPRVIIQQFHEEQFSRSQIASKMLAKNNEIDTTHLLADLNASTPLQDTSFQEKTKNIQQSAISCKSRGNIYSKEELEKDLQEIDGGGLSEDVGRYIGYGWKTFSRENNFLFPLISAPFTQGCHGINHDANLLCNHQEAIDNFEINTLRKLLKELQGTNTPGEELLKKAINKFDQNHNSDRELFDPQEFRDEIVDLRQYYQSHSISYKSEGCNALNPIALTLCENPTIINEFQINHLRELYQTARLQNRNESQTIYKAIETYNNLYLKKLTEQLKTSKKTDIQTIINKFHKEVNNIHQNLEHIDPDNKILTVQYRNDLAPISLEEIQGTIEDLQNFVLKYNKTLSIPYRYLTPLNITMNRSLQNLSSYYTDIGFIRVIFYFISIITLITAIIKREKKILNIALTTFIGRGIRRIIGGGILRYGTVLISWTMITILSFFQQEEENTIKRNLILITLGFAIAIQLVLNFIRISSQGGVGAFIRYKGNIGIEQIYTKNGEPTKRIKYGYNEKDVFNIQFRQYNSIINYLKERKDEDGVTIAGTYIQYFLDNQMNVSNDGMLEGFRKKTSDGDLCKTYRRIKNANKKYLILDPNIGSVGMGEGNETLFHRFFGKLNAVTGKIEKDGIITTLIKMQQNGYIKLINTNNIGAYYALTLTDEEYTQYLDQYLLLFPDQTTREEKKKSLSRDDIVLSKSKMMVMRYFDELNDFYSFVTNIFMRRIREYKAVPEISGILGLEGDVEKIRTHLLKNQTHKDLSDLTQDERMIYMFYQNANSSYIQQLTAQSIGSSSQIIGIELQ